MDFNQSRPYDRSKIVLWVVAIVLLLIVAFVIYNNYKTRRSVQDISDKITANNTPIQQPAQ